MNKIYIEIVLRNLECVKILMQISKIPRMNRKCHSHSLLAKTHADLTNKKVMFIIENNNVGPNVDMQI